MVELLVIVLVYVCLVGGEGDGGCCLWVDFYGDVMVVECEVVG